MQRRDLAMLGSGGVLFAAVFLPGGMLAVWTGGNACDVKLRRQVCRACIDLPVA